MPLLYRLLHRREHADPLDHARDGDRRPLADLSQDQINLIWREWTGQPPPNRRDQRRPR